MLFTRNKRPLKILLLGYGGAGNTGSDVRLMTILDDVREVFGDEAQITVATQDREKTLHIIPERDNVRVEQVPYVFVRKVWQLTRDHDVTLLVEGSTFKQNWSRWLLYGYLWAAWCAKRAGNHCVAYAVDAGDLSPFNAKLTRKVCDGMDLLITRTEAARDKLIEMGVQKPVLANTDTAFRYRAFDVPMKTPRPVVGIAPIEFFQWPVKLQPFAARENRFRWPFAFSWDDERRAKSARMIGNFRGLIEHITGHHGMDVKLIAMEELDTPFCEKILATLPTEARARVTMASSRDVRPNRMVPMLRSLDYLVTSRYHAGVLSMAGAVPQMAVCHDERLRTIYEEIGIDREFLLDYRAADLGRIMVETFDKLVRCAPEVRGVLRKKHDGYYLAACAQNKADLRDWAAATFEAVPRKNTKREDRACGSRSR